MARPSQGLLLMLSVLLAGACAKLPEPEPPRDPTLLAKLGPTEIGQGVDAVRPSVEACGQRLGAPMGTRVEVQFLIVGETGLVASAHATKEWANTPVGECVAEEAGRARFPRFALIEQSVWYEFQL